ncbi:MAG: insulinase family protein [Candidatus Eisenbacteria bacterium]|uniref:Insulinase family protein n=1 Tax=Eiseniibacteriota bacterium TaxID=2212470 RepID=A0A538TZR1_UNCEI|nr:MAG: insulinase family protein [Candidatus Eisenbacteria bacterium]
MLNVPVETFTLKNGLRVAVHEDHSVPLVAVNVWYHVGSGREVKGRTGFAHLFEHIMFQGSKNVGDDQHFAIVQEAGGTANGSTNADRTNYFEMVPSNDLETALWLEADRMGTLLATLTRTKLDNQRDVVKNERRQRYENAPYGMGSMRVGEMLYPPDHPYHWPTIGSMDDLSAASLEDVKSFFAEWYAPDNACLVIAGDVKVAEVKRLVTKYFGDIPRGEARPALPHVAASLASDQRDVMEDQVTLPQIMMAWHSVPLWGRDDAALDVLAGILGQGKASRLYERLVYREQAAQSVSAFQFSREQAGSFHVTIQAREGHTLTEMEKEILEEIARMAKEGPTARELEQAKNGIVADEVRSVETLLGKADRINGYMTFRGRPDLFNEELQRYRDVTIEDVRRVAQTYLTRPRVVLSIVPKGKRELAAAAAAP